MKGRAFAVQGAQNRGSLDFDECKYRLIVPRLDYTMK